MKDSSFVGRLRAGTFLILLVAVAPGCVPQGLALVRDRRVEIVAPESHATVQVPVAIRWRVERFQISGRDGRATDDAGYFGIFVDREPVPPEKTLSWVAHDDRSCHPEDECPSSQYLTDRGVYSTTATTFTLPVLKDLKAYRGHELHEVTIVLLDGTGHRIGESAFYIAFFYERKGF